MSCFIIIIIKNTKYVKIDVEVYLNGLFLFRGVMLSWNCLSDELRQN